MSIICGMPPWAKLSTGHFRCQTLLLTASEPVAPLSPESLIHLAAPSLKSFALVREATLKGLKVSSLFSRFQPLY